jgi:hypothetical protein
MMVYHPINEGADPRAETAQDRRRAGRDNNVSLALVQLLRGTSIDHLSDPEADEDPDPLAGARGILFWGLFSIALWMLVVRAVWVLYSRVT